VSVVVRRKSRRRSVTLCDGTPHAPGWRSGSTALWAFGYDALARLFGCSVAHARALVSAGRVDPRSLESVARYWASSARRPLAGKAA
jgi:hypothetical protein